MEIAKEILNQLGGTSRLSVMVNAKYFAVQKVGENEGVSFRFSGSRKTNYVLIVLNSIDLYDIQFGKIHGNNFKVVSEFKNIYADQLRHIFERETGLYLRLFKHGGVTPESRVEKAMNGLKSVHKNEHELHELIEKKQDVSTWVLERIKKAEKELKEAESNESMKFGAGGVSPVFMYAEIAKRFAPKSVNAIDERTARRINPDPNRPIFF